MRLFNNIKKKEYPRNDVFDKEEVIKEILERIKSECPGWNLFVIARAYPSTKPEYSFYDTNCDFFAIYTDIINKEIRLNGNPFSDYKRTVESVYQIVREVHLTDKNLEDIDFETYQIYKPIVASSAKEFFIKLKKELE